MPPENIDDLFRDKLDGHPTPPGADLWARLQAGAPAEPSAERLDQLFQKGLTAHATPVRPELWERLEDEHLRPRKRRAAAWWPMALAAAVALLFLAGGAGLWLGFPAGSTQTGTVASRGTDAKTPAARPAPAAKTAPRNSGDAISESGAVASTNPLETSKTAQPASSEKIYTAQATRSRDLASTAPKAKMSAPGQSPRNLKGSVSRPDAAAGTLPLVARTTARPATQPASTRPPVADEQRTTTQPAVALETEPQTDREIVPVRTIPTPTLASAGELITVDVRNGSDAAVRAGNTPSFTATADAAADRRRLGGRLLQQAGNLVRGERVSLSEAAGLPENVTVRAVIAGRTLTKSIQL